MAISRLPEEAAALSPKTPMDKPGPMPTVYAIASPDGAGKTTFATGFLPNHANCRQFLNADLIAAGLAPFAPETQNVRAGRLLLDRIRELSAARENFGFQTTLVGRGHVKLLPGLKRSGHRVVLYFLWLPGAELAVRRVANRVRMGGHGVPEHDVRRRFESGLCNLFQLYRCKADVWWLYDASNPSPILIAREEDGISTPMDAETFLRIQKQGEGRAS